MKKLIISILLFSIFVSLSAAVRWATKEEVDQKNKLLKEGGYEISAMAFCDTKKDVEKITRIIDLDDYFSYVYTLEKNEIPEKDVYIVGFLEDRIIVVCRKTEGIAECYFIYK